MVEPVTAAGVTSAATGAAGAAQSAVGAVGDAVSSTASGMAQSAGNWLTNAITAPFRWVWSGVTAPFRWVGSLFGSPVEAVTSLPSKVGGGAVGAVKGAVNLGNVPMVLVIAGVETLVTVNSPKTAVAARVALGLVKKKRPAK